MALTTGGMTICAFPLKAILQGSGTGFEITVAGPHSNSMLHAPLLGVNARGIPTGNVRMAPGPATAILCIGRGVRNQSFMCLLHDGQELLLTVALSR